MISFNNIPATIRTPGTYAEVDNSRALKNLAANPHRVLILGQKESTGTANKEEVKSISNEVQADGFFGVGSILARMCRAFKMNNPNTELLAMALSDASATGKASGVITFTGSATADGNIFFMAGGSGIAVPITSGWSQTDAASALASAIQADPHLCIRASLVTSTVVIKAVASGEIGNYHDIRVNYYDGQTNTAGLTPVITALAGGVGSPNIGGAWAIIENDQYHNFIQPYTDAATLTSLESELEDRFGPLIDKQGFGYTAARGTAASCTTLGLTRNSPHNMIMGVYDSPTNPEIWAAAVGAICAGALNNDPARPLHTLRLKGVLPPPSVNRFSRTERDILLYDGISTYIVDNGGNVLLERIITTYRTNALGAIDVSYLDITTMFTLMEIRYQWVTRMSNRFIAQRFKLADDTFPVQPGTNIATPKTIKQETVALFSQLQDVGLIENLNDFIENLVVERDGTDVNRVNVLLAPDLINQFMVLAGKLQFIL